MEVDLSQTSGKRLKELQMMKTYLSQADQWKKEELQMMKTYLFVFLAGRFLTFFLEGEPLAAILCSNCQHFKNAKLDFELG